MKAWMKSIFRNSFLYLPLFHLIKKNEYYSDMKIADQVEKVGKELSENGCKLIFVLPPTETHIQKLSRFEKERIRSWTFDFNNISKADASIISKLYPGNNNTDYIKSLYDGAKVVSIDGRKHLADFRSENVNIIQGCRVTPDAPLDFTGSIHIYGSCTARGTGVADCETIANYLQIRINRSIEKDTSTEDKALYRCVNHGIGCGSTVEDDIYAIRKTVFRPGDIVIICNILSGCADKLIAKRNDFFDSSLCFNRPHDFGEWFTDTTAHTNKNGNRVIADYIYSILDENGYLQNRSLSIDCALSERSFIIQSEDDRKAIESWQKSEEFRNYQQYLKKHQVREGKRNGAIVMNCNPFTLGHRYLIETAAAQVDTLFIFVVEEDKSYFPFADRFRLVQKGTEDISNVMVLRSGKFIISAVTFPGYFYKDNDKSAIVDTSNDIDLFAQHIAPVLNIKVRFAGEEPLDPVTRQYNETMRERLPVYGIEYKEIKRKQEGDNVISASRVRNDIKNGDYENLRLLVPESTYRYLIERFFDNAD